MNKTLALINFEGVMQSGVAGVRDLNLMCQQTLKLLGKTPPFQLTELDITSESIQEIQKPGDIVFLPPVFMAPELIDILLPEMEFVVSWLRRLQRFEQLQICSCCTSTLLLAKAGLLDGRQATTTWWMLKDLEERFPKIRVQANDMLVESGNIITSSGPFSFISQFLYLVEQEAGPEASRLLAKLAVAEPGKPANGIYAVPNLFSSQDAWLARLHELITENLQNNISVKSIAQKLNLTERTLHRRVKEKAGMSPREMISNIKLEVAKTLLETSCDPITSISEAVGFIDDSSFRSAFTKGVGISPSAYRSRMNPKQNGNIP